MIYEEYEQKCNEIQMRNSHYLDEFRKEMLNAGLKKKTIERH